VADNLIELISRYRIGERRDPREDRLTAALVAVLQHSSRLTRTVLTAWNVTSADATPTRVTLQLAVPRAGGWVDAEVLLGAEPSPRARVWIEAKLWSRLSGDDQLERYAKALAARACGPGQRHLLLLAPASRRAEFLAALRSAATRSVRCDFVSWQETFSALDTGRGRESRVVSWLAAQLLQYAKEEGLVAPNKLTKGHIEALRQFDDATSALELLRHKAQESVGHWSPVVDVTSGHGYYVEVRHRPQRTPGAPRMRWVGTTRFYWGFGYGDCFAGLYYDTTRGPLTSRRQSAEFLAILADQADGQSWGHDPAPGAYAFMTRYRSLRDFVGETLDEQAAQVAVWVIEVFDELMETATASRRAHDRRPSLASASGRR
jgi:hypothetical protein